MNVESEIDKLYKFLMNSAKVEQTELSAEDEIRGKRNEGALEAIFRPDNLIKLDFVSNRGIYLLEMLNGMGKTTFKKCWTALHITK